MAADMSVGCAPEHLAILTYDGDDTYFKWYGLCDECLDSYESKIVGISQDMDYISFDIECENCGHITMLRKCI